MHTLIEAKFELVGSAYRVYQLKNIEVEGSTYLDKCTAHFFKCESERLAECFRHESLTPQLGMDLIEYLSYE